MKRFFTICLGALIGLLFTLQVTAQKPSCSGNSYSSEILIEKPISETCTEYEIKVSYDGTRAFGLSHYTMEIPCGEIKNVSNSENWKVVFGKDPTTGVYGLKIDDISGFGERGADSFTIKFTWCSNNSCEKELGVVSYKAGRCVDYDTLSQIDNPEDTVTQICSSLLASLQKKNATCATSYDGELKVVIQEGEEPFTFSWSNGATTNTAQNLSAGTYYVTVTDAKGNVLTLTETLTASPPIVISESITNPFCSGAASGSIELTVSGGSGGYSFAWSNGSTQQNISNLAGGLYTVTVSDAIGCSAQKTFMLTNSTLISATASLKNTSCAQTNGGIDLTPNGGLAPYTFLWNNGATTEDLQNVSAGIYSVTIKDAAGCSTNKQYTIKVNNTLAITHVITPVSCLGGTSGSIDLTVFGGTPPYSYQWQDGPTTEDRSGLSPAQYSVTVTDASGCTAKANLAIFKKPLQVSNDISQPKCAGDLGSIDLTAEGTAPYTYIWSNGETDESITDLPPGFYSVAVTDATGCTRVLDFAIISPIAIVVNSAISNPQCGTDGSFAIDLSVMGGKPPYSFLWSTGATTQNVSGLNAGSYSVSISDAGGCTLTREFTVDQVSAGWSCLIAQPVAATVCGSVGNLLSTEVIDATAYQWTVTSSDNSWSITSGSTSSTAVYTAGTAGSTATFTLTITKNGCSQTCSYTANSCTVKDNTGGGDPSSDEPCVNSTTAKPATESPNETVEEPVQETQDEAFKLEVYPNPFRDKLNFEFTATSNDFVQIEILDKFGNRITMLYEGNVSKGQHYNFDWTSAGLKDHIYFYRFISSKFVDYGKLLRK